MNVFIYAIPWSISIISLIFVILTFSRNGRKDTKVEVKENIIELSSIKEGLLKANMKLDQVCSTTIETRSDIKSLNNGLNDMDRRVNSIEQRLEFAFEQIEELKGK